VTTYALADTQVQWFADDFPGIRFEPNCGVLHTTETTGWPGYEGGATAPNYTARPDFNAKRLRWRAHFHDEMSSRALRNLAGGVETNTLNAVQVELVGTCDPAKRDLWVKAGMRQDRDFIYWPEAPEWALRDLAAFIVDMHQRHHILIQGPDVWMAYPASFGISNPNRFTFAQWRAFYGWCGHQHVPENCVHPDTPILMADLTWKRAGDCHVGDEIVSFDQETHRVGNANGGRRYRLGTITQNTPAAKDSYRLTTTQGTVTASADHPWLVRLPYVNRGSRIAWVETQHLDPEKHRIISLGEPWEPENTYSAGWLAGALDADGHAFAGKRHGSWVGFGQVDGAVLDMFLAECDRRGWTTKVIRRDWTKRGPQLSANPKDFTDVRILGGMWESARVLGTLRPVRLLPKAAQMWQGAVVGKTTGDVAVLSVEHVGEQPVASISTDTHTYVADGLLCHNSHGDPGALPWAKVIEYALELLGPEPPAWNRPRWPRPKTREVVAYHNVFGGLDDDKARQALDLVLVTRPDIVGLGEWGPNRRRFLAEHDDYMWIKPGGSYPPVGARKDRYRCFTVHGVTLAKSRPVEKKPGKPSRGFLPDNHATVVVWEEIQTGHMVTTVCFHLPSFIEADGVWLRVAGGLTKRARMAREAKRKLRKIAKAHWARGRRVYLLGDSNFDEMRLTPLTSCWTGRKARATHGRRTIDVVYAQQPARHIITLATPSDHKAVVAYYPEES